jgi:hypothetical protein
MEMLIKDWLRRKRNLEAPACLFGAVGLLVLGVIVVAVTAYLCFFFFLFGWFGIAAAWELAFGYRLPRWPWKGVGVGTFLFLVLLFIYNARTTWWERGDLPKGNWGEGEKPSYFVDPFAILRASVKFVLDIFYTGPRLLAASWRTLRKAWRLWKMDLENCSQVLAALFVAGRVVSRHQLSTLLSSCSLTQLEEQMKDIEGVAFLEDGLSLTGELRSEFIRRAYAPV